MAHVKTFLPIFIYTYLGGGSCTFSYIIAWGWKDLTTGNSRLSAAPELIDDLLGKKYITRMNFCLYLEAVIFRGPTNAFLSVIQPD